MTRPHQPKPIQMWALQNLGHRKCGSRIIPRSVHQTRKEVIKWISNYTSWKKQYRQGWRIIKVMVTEDIGES